MTDNRHPISPLRARMCLWLLVAALGPLLAAAPCPAAERQTAFVNVNLVAMTGPEVQTGQTVIVRGRTIERIGPAGELQPPGARIIDGRGLFLMPGLADMHVHLKGRWRTDQTRLYLANGVTTVRDLDGRPEMLALRRKIEQGEVPGPEILIASPVIYGLEKDPVGLAARRAREPWDCIKIYSYFSDTDFQSAIALFKDKDCYVVGHIPIAVGLERAIGLGQNESAHLEEFGWEFFDFDRKAKRDPREWYRYLIELSARYAVQNGPRPDAALRRKMDGVVRRTAEAGMAVCTTLTVMDAAGDKLADPSAFLARDQARWFDPAYALEVRLDRDKHQRYFAAHPDLPPVILGWLKDLALAMDRAGVVMCLGTDAGPTRLGVVPGYSVHDELALLVSAGLSPFAALKTATLNAALVAERMTGKGGFGTIETGQRADLLLIRGNPLEDVSAAARPLGVMAAGRWYDRAALETLLRLPAEPRSANGR